MNIQKIIPKLSKSIKYDRLNLIYLDLINHPILEPMIKSISPIDTLKLVFGVYEYKKGNHDIQSVLNGLDIELYAFSLVHFTNENPEIKCEECDGTGRVDCSSCDGTGEVECDNCYGTGTVEDDEGDDVDCDECDNGYTSCEYCSNGSESCYECEGEGVVESNQHTEYSMEVFVSYDRELFDKLQIVNNSNIPIDGDFEREIITKSLMINRRMPDISDNLDIAEEIDKKLRGETFINKISEILEFSLAKYDKEVRVPNLEELEIEKFN